MISFLATLFLGKSPRDSLPVFSAHSFTNYLNLLFLNQRKTEKFFANECAKYKADRPLTQARGLVFIFMLKT